MTYGPIDFLALEFKGTEFKGEILPELLELVKNKIVRVVDLIIVQKDEDGKHRAFELQQLDHSPTEQRVVVDHEDGVVARH